MNISSIQFDIAYPSTNYIPVSYLSRIKGFYFEKSKIHFTMTVMMVVLFSFHERGSNANTTMKRTVGHWNDTKGRRITNVEKFRSFGIFGRVSAKVGLEII